VPDLESLPVPLQQRDERDGRWTGQFGRFVEGVGGDLMPQLDPLHFTALRSTLVPAMSKPPPSLGNVLQRGRVQPTP